MPEAQRWETHSFLPVLVCTFEFEAIDMSCLFRKKKRVSRQQLIQKSVLQSLCPWRGWAGPVGTPPTLHRGWAGSHVGPAARHMPPPGSSCVAEAAAGWRLGRSRRSCLAQMAHAGQGHGPGIWVWLGSFPGQTGHKASL